MADVNRFLHLLRSVEMTSGLEVAFGVVGLDIPALTLWARM